MLTTVMNLSTGTEEFYTLEPREAVISAYLRSMGISVSDSTEREKVKGKITTGKYSVCLGDFSAMYVREVV